MTEQSTQSQTQEPRDYTISELDAAVGNGQITQAQRDQIFATQVERSAARKASEAAMQIVETQTQENSLDGELQQYVRISPDLMREGSPLRSRVAEEFEYLVSRGAPRNLSTELAATRAVMGPPDRARSIARGRARGADMSQDSFNSRPMSKRESREEDMWSRLSPHQQAYYSKQINSGLYASKSAVLSELTWRRGSSKGAA